MKLLRLVVLLVCLIALPGCGLIDYYFLPEPEDTAQELYENAGDAMRDKKYGTAAEYYTKIKDNYPFSPYALEAELSLGDAYFLDGKYAEASEAYKEFESLHPRHEAIPYVLYQIGMSELKTFISVDRPTTMIQQALEYFNRLQELYPDSEYATKAGGEIHNCRKLLAEHELYLGDMFWQMKKYGSAWKRYTYIVENFSAVPEVSEHARSKAEAAYFHYTEQTAEESRRKQNGHWSQWFDWL